jgi:hypothetical protein
MARFLCPITNNMDPVPAPSTMLLLGTGLLGFLGYGWQRKRQTA